MPAVGNVSGGLSGPPLGMRRLRSSTRAWRPSWRAGTNWECPSRERPSCGPFRKRHLAAVVARRRWLRDGRVQKMADPQEMKLYF